MDAIELRTDKPTPRAFGLLLDEFHVEASSTDAVRAILTHFVESSVRPGDAVLVFKPLDSLMALQPTTDMQSVLKTIGGFTGRKGDFTARTTFEQKYMAQAPNAVAAARAQIVSSGLREVASRLGELPDVRPAVVLVSDGFARQRVDRNVPANLLSSVRVANRGDVPVYVFAPDTGGAPLPGATEPDPAQVVLEAVAAQTGGDFNPGIASFAGGLTRMIRELDTHYVLTYQAPHGEDGRFHSLQISLNKPNARVRARAGYVAPLSADLRAALSPPPVPTRVLKRSGLIQAWSGVTKGGEGKARVTLTWEPALAPRRPAPRAGADCRHGLDAKRDGVVRRERDRRQRRTGNSGDEPCGIRGAAGTCAARSESARREGRRDRFRCARRRCTEHRQRSSDDPGASRSGVPDRRGSFAPSVRTPMPRRCRRGDLC